MALTCKDSFGIVRSRAILSAGTQVLLPLNISESRQTAIGRFISAFGGAGVQHVAFAVDNAVAAVTDLMTPNAGLLSRRAPPPRT